MLEFTVMDALTASGSRQSFRDAGGQGTIVFDPARLGQATPALFDPGSYGARAHAVQDKGGRGAAWFVQGEFGDGVLRHYRRGGWMAHASKDAYWWRGERRVRSLHEFRHNPLFADALGQSATQSENGTLGANLAAGTYYIGYGYYGPLFYGGGAAARPTVSQIIIKRTL